MSFVILIKVILLFPYNFSVVIIQDAYEKSKVHDCIFFHHSMAMNHAIFQERCMQYIQSCALIYVEFMHLYVEVLKYLYCKYCT